MKRQCAATLMGLTLAVNAYAGAVVVAKTSPISPLDEAQVKKIFLGRQLSVSGEPVMVLYQGEGPERTDFETKVLGKTGADLTIYWSKLIFTGKAAAPVQATKTSPAKSKTGEEIPAIDYISDEAWAKLVASGKVRLPIEAGGDDSVKAILGHLPNAIGYISDAAVDNSVKVVLHY
jgi:ABC-type phosphate transport system substrate-binding protein